MLDRFFEGDFSRLSEAREQCVNEDAINPRSRSRFHQLVYGVVRRYRSLDSVIQKFSDAPLKRVQSRIQEVLRVGLYEILFFDSTPSHASVDECVKIAKNEISNDSGGFVNAVLRESLRNMTEDVWDYPEEMSRKGIEHLFYIGRGRAREFQKSIFPAPGEHREQTVQFFSRSFNLPEWLVETWLEAYGEEDTYQIARNQADIPSLYVRRNPLKTSEASFEELLEEQDISYQSLEIEHFYELEKVGDPAQIEGFRDGYFTMQDPAVGLVAADLSPGPGDRILDVCAAPGGKTGQFIEQSNGKANVFAMDNTQRRMEWLKENRRRLDWTDAVTPVIGDGRHIPFEEERFDSILLDVPCSNTAVLSRRVEARYHLNDGFSRELVDLQKQLLTRALKSADASGEILYSTCSLLPEENEILLREVLENVQDVRLSHPEFIFPGEISSAGSFSAVITKV